MSCRGSTKAQSQEACFSWTSDTGKWTLTWYVLAPLRLNPWKCINPFLGDPIRVRTTFLTKFYNKTGTITPSFLKVFNPLFSGPIRVRATFLSKSYNKTGTITSSFLKVSNPLFNVPTRVRTTFLTKTYNKTGTITSSFLKVSSPIFSGPVGDRTTFLIQKPIIRLVSLCLNSWICPTHFEMVQLGLGPLFWPVPEIRLVSTN